MLLAQLLAGFQSLPPLPTCKLGSFGADSWVGGFVSVLGPCGSVQWTLLWGWEFLPLLQPPQIFIVRGFEEFFFFPYWDPGFWVCLTLQLFLPVYLHATVEPPGPLATASPTLVFQPMPCCESLPQLLLSAPPISLDECFFFNSLVVRLAYSLIFWQLWLFFLFLNLLLSFSWLYKEANYMYLCLHLGQKSWQ